jgi:hypothetical protein
MTAPHPSIKAEGTNAMLQKDRGYVGIVDSLDEPAGRFSRGRAWRGLGAADWLHLAATPTFAMMALSINFLGGGSMTGSMASHTSPLGGMVLMYWLMTVFHFPPWLRLISRRRIGAIRS